VARDYAKSRKSAASKRKPARKRPAGKDRGGHSWRSFTAGLLIGVFASFLAYLGTLPPTGEPGTEPAAPAAAEAPPPKPRFDFYTLLPEQTIDVDVEPVTVERAAEPANPQAAAEVYILQAGSFRQREDADRRRAELLLLGLEPFVEASDGDNGRWHRVYLGPFESRAQMNRARGLTAGQGIETLALKRPAP
jgi:cell division protein FtsN